MEILRIAPVLITTAALLAWQFLARKPIKIQIYRPERHYMRGPGPKYRAKHGL